MQKKSANKLKTIDNWKKLVYLSVRFSSDFFYIKSFSRNIQVNYNTFVYTCWERNMVLNYNAISK